MATSGWYPFCDRSTRTFQNNLGSEGALLRCNLGICMHERLLIFLVPQDIPADKVAASAKVRRLVDLWSCVARKDCGTAIPDGIR